jgi:hypothetical protein
MGSIRTYLAPTGKPGAPSRHTPKLFAATEAPGICPALASETYFLGFA